MLEADGWTAASGLGAPRQRATAPRQPGQLLEQGRRDIRFSIWDPESFSDYWADANEILGQLQADGHGRDHGQRLGRIHAVAERDEAGQYQTALHWGAGGNIPFVQLENWLDYDVTCTGTP